MNISKALKRKKKLTTEIEKIKGLITCNNNYTEPNKPVYDVNTLLSSLDNKTTELVDLKLKLAQANIGINETIYLMAELKGKVSTLKNTSTSESVQYNGERDIVRKSVINTIDMDEMIVILEKQIEELQDKIDYYNQTTNI